MADAGICARCRARLQRDEPHDCGTLNTWTVEQLRALLPLVDSTELAGRIAAELDTRERWRNERKDRP